MTGRSQPGGSCGPRETLIFVAPDHPRSPLVLETEAARCARDYVGTSFPDARIAMLGGSAETGYASATSDLDIVIVHGPGGPVLRRTARHGTRLVEAFVHTEASLAEFIDRDIATRRRSSLLHMCAEGRLLIETDGLGAALQRRCRLRLRDGPQPLSPTEDEDRRYAVTDLLDDLASCADPGELVFVAGSISQALAELVLLRDRQWSSSGKWLLRRLRDWAPDVASMLVDGYRRSVADADPAPLHAAATAVLDRYGGRLQEGYERRVSGR